MSNFTNLASSSEWRNEVNQTLLLVALYTLMPSGILMNLVQVAVYFRHKFSRNSMCVYLIVLSFNNIFVLISTSLRFTGTIKIYDYEENTNLGCRLAQFFIRFFYTGCTWLNFLLTLDRLIFILYPNKFKILQTKYNIFKILLIMYSILFILNSPSLFFTNTQVFNNVSNESVFVCVASPPLSISREAIAQFLGMYIPFILMFGTNIFLIKKLTKSKNKFSSAKEMNFSLSLIVSNIIFLISFIPLCVLLVIIMLVTIDPTIPQDPEVGSNLALFETCVFIVSCYNYSLGLIVQLIFNKLFREEFIYMLIEMISKLKKENLTQSSSTN